VAGGVIDEVQVVEHEPERSGRADVVDERREHRGLRVGDRPASAPSEREPMRASRLASALTTAIQKEKTWLSSGASCTQAVSRSRSLVIHCATSVDLP